MHDTKRASVVVGELVSVVEPCERVGNHDRTLTEMWPDSSNDEYFHLVKAWQALARPPQKQPAVQVEETVSTTNTPPEDFDITSIELVRRYQVSLDRQLRNTLLNLRQYRKDFAAPPPQPASPPLAPNEPEATPPPPPPTPVEPQTNPRREANRQPRRAFKARRSKKFLQTFR